MLNTSSFVLQITFGIAYRSPILLYGFDVATISIRLVKNISSFAFVVIVHTVF